MATLLPTTRHRRGRRTPRQQRALAEPGAALVSLSTLEDSDFPCDFLDPTKPIVLDIGFGSGAAVVALAEADPDTMIIAIDTHTPGIGDLLASIQERDIGNVLVVEADVRHVLPYLPQRRLAGIRTFFPDPWPKQRHHRRRLITDDFARDVAGHVVDGGYWHVATDWPDYARAIREAVTSTGLWSGGRIPRPVHRPSTRYERRGLAAGREPIDLWFTR